MKTKSRELPVFRSLTFSLVFLFLATTNFATPEAYGQRLLDRIRENIEKRREDGGLLGQLFQGDDQKESERENGNRPDRQNPNYQRGRSSQQPTLATPPQQHPTEFGAALEPANNGRGLIISRIQSQLAGYVAGLREEDRILSVGGIPTNTLQDFQNILEILKPGDRLEFEFERAGRKEQTVVQLGNRPAASTGQAANSRQHAPSRQSSQRSPGTNHSDLGHSVLTQNGSRSENNWLVDPPSLTPGSNRSQQRSLSDLRGSTSTQSLSNEVQKLQQQVLEQQQLIQQLQAQLEAQQNNWSREPSHWEPRTRRRERHASLGDPQSQ